MSELCHCLPLYLSDLDDSPHWAMKHGIIQERLVFDSSIFNSIGEVVGIIRACEKPKMQFSTACSPAARHAQVRMDPNKAFSLVSLLLYGLALVHSDNIETKLMTLNPWGLNNCMDSAFPRFLSSHTV